MPDTPFQNLAGLCTELEKTTGRKEKTRQIADFLRSLNPDEVKPATLLLAGTVFPEFDGRSLDVGWKTMRGRLSNRGQTTLFRQPLSILQVHRTLSTVAEQTGSGSRDAKERLLDSLYLRASGSERDILTRIIFNNMRIGASEGVIIEAIAEASEQPPLDVRRALMVTGDLGLVAFTAVTGGVDELRRLKASIFVPLKPMLADMAEDVEDALETHGGRTAFEYKYDGARIQIHRKEGQVKVYSRRLSDVTESLPDVVEMMGALDAEEYVVEGEVTAVGESGKPLPFQDLMRRFRRVTDVQETAESIPLRLHLFDALMLEDELLIDAPYTERWRRLSEVAPVEFLAERIVTAEASEAERLFKAALDDGHEGLIAKRLDSLYSPGNRGKNWLKIKTSMTLDVVVAAADWGSGRRRGWLSNYHLAVRSGDAYLVIGKTFKGLTDDQFRWMTDRLQGLALDDDGYTVTVNPVVVLEVEFNEVQRSPHYRSGYALRFARVKRIREDKGGGDVDSLGEVKRLYEEQFRYKDRLEP